jgi:hypothetical protein
MRNCDKGTTLTYIPQLQDAGDVSRGEDPADVVEVSHIQAPVRATGEGQGGQQLVPISEAVATGAGNTSSASIAHGAADDRRLLRHKLVLPVPFVQDAWDKERESSPREQGVGSSCGRPATESPSYCKAGQVLANHVKICPPTVKLRGT